MGRVATVLLATAILSVSSISFATTWRVPAQCPTIQAGIDSASAGDTVLVACGTYYEYDIAMRSGIYLASEAGEADCVTIDAQKQGRVFYCDNVDNTATIEGFTITRGYASGSIPDSRGGGMYCPENSSPTLIGCVFSDNLADFGGAIYCYKHASPTLTSCVFSGNSAAGAGGIHCGYDACPVLTNCTFVENSATSGGGGAMSCIGGGCPTVVNCVFSGNSADDGGAVECWMSWPVFTNCTFCGNLATFWGGGAIGLHKFSCPTITGCTFYGNSGPQAGIILCDIYCDPAVANTIIAFNTDGGAIVCWDGSSPTLRCCDIYGNAGGDWIGCIADQKGINGNIWQDPLFCDPASGDLHLHCLSPCAPAQQPECGLIGAWGVGCGATGAERRTWSSLKSLYH